METIHRTIENKKISDKKLKQLEAFNKLPITVGEMVSVEEGVLYRNSTWASKKESTKTVYVDIVSIEGDNLTVTLHDYPRNDKYVILTSDVKNKYNRIHVGANPFTNVGGDIRPVSYSFDSILFELELRERKRDENYEFDGIKCEEVNWNPYVYDKNGNKQYYQRDFVWSLEDKQTLIESIYNHINCGLILVRKRGWKEIENMRKKGETELAFRDIVDGKQRLGAIKQFLANEFADAHGNYFNDLSFAAQNKFTDHQLFQYAELPENSKDSDVIAQFLKLNFAGVPQSKEHISFVKDILKLV